MSRFAAVIFAFVLMLPAVNSSARTPEMADVWNGAEINWRDIRSGIYEASKSGRMAVMVFHAPWCTACKKYRAVFKDPRIVEASKNFVMILIDADADKMTNGAFSPDGTYVPRTLFVTSEGDVSTTLVGKDPQYPHTIDINSPDELLSLMQKAAPASPSSPAAPAGDNRT
jgi:protein-disulfide reductase (glutathione)